MDSRAGEDDRESCRRVCLICGNTEKELSVYVLRPPGHFNGWIQHELSSIHSSLLISNDQEGEKIQMFVLYPNNVACTFTRGCEKDICDYSPFCNSRFIAFSLVYVPYSLFPVRTMVSFSFRSD